MDKANKYKNSFAGGQGSVKSSNKRNKIHKITTDPKGLNVPDSHSPKQQHSKDQKENLTFNFEKGSQCHDKTDSGLDKDFLRSDVSVRYCTMIPENSKVKIVKHKELRKQPSGENPSVVFKRKGYKAKVLPLDEKHLEFSIKQSQCPMTVRIHKGLKTPSVILKSNAVVEVSSVKHTLSLININKTTATEEEEILNNLKITSSRQNYKRKHITPVRDNKESRAFSNEGLIKLKNKKTHFGTLNNSSETNYILKQNLSEEKRLKNNLYLSKSQHGTKDNDYYDVRRLILSAFKNSYSKSSTNKKTKDKRDFQGQEKKLLGFMVKERPVKREKKVLTEVEDVKSKTDLHHEDYDAPRAKKKKNSNHLEGKFLHPHKNQYCGKFFIFDVNQLENDFWHENITKSNPFLNVNEFFDDDNKHSPNREVKLVHTKGDKELRKIKIGSKNLKHQFIFNDLPVKKQTEGRDSVYKDRFKSQNTPKCTKSLTSDVVILNASNSEFSKISNFLANKSQRSNFSGLSSRTKFYKSREDFFLNNELSEKSIKNRSNSWMPENKFVKIVSCKENIGNVLTFKGKMKSSTVEKLRRRNIPVSLIFSRKPGTNKCYKEIKPHTSSVYCEEYHKKTIGTGNKPVFMFSTEKQNSKERFHKKSFPDDKSKQHISSDYDTIPQQDPGPFMEMIYDQINPNYTEQKPEHFLNNKEYSYKYENSTVKGSYEPGYNNVSIQCTSTQSTLNEVEIGDTTYSVEIHNSKPLFNDSFKQKYQNGVNEASYIHKASKHTLSTDKYNKHKKLTHERSENLDSSSLPKKHTSIRSNNSKTYSLYGRNTFLDNNKTVHCPIVHLESVDYKIKSNIQNKRIGLLDQKLYNTNDVNISRRNFSKSTPRTLKPFQMRTPGSTHCHAERKGSSICLQILHDSTDDIIPNSRVKTSNQSSYSALPNKYNPEYPSGITGSKNSISIGIQTDPQSEEDFSELKNVEINSQKWDNLERLFHRINEDKLRRFLQEKQINRQTKGSKTEFKPIFWDKRQQLKYYKQENDFELVDRINFKKVSKEEVRPRFSTRLESTQDVRDSFGSNEKRLSLAMDNKLEILGSGTSKKCETLKESNADEHSRQIQYVSSDKCSTKLFIEKVNSRDANNTPLNNDQHSRTTVFFKDLPKSEFAFSSEHKYKIESHNPRVEHQKKFIMNSLADKGSNTINSGNVKIRSNSKEMFISDEVFPPYKTTKDQILSENNFRKKTGYESQSSLGSVPYKSGKASDKPSQRNQTTILNDEIVSTKGSYIKTAHLARTLIGSSRLSNCSLSRSIKTTSKINIEGGEESIISLQLNQMNGSFKFEDRNIRSTIFQSCTESTAPLEVGEPNKLITLELKSPLKNGRNYLAINHKELQASTFVDEAVEEGSLNRSAPYMTESLRSYYQEFENQSKFGLCNSLETSRNIRNQFIVQPGVALEKSTSKPGETENDKSLTQQSLPGISLTNMEQFRSANKILGPQEQDVHNTKVLFRFPSVKLERDSHNTENSYDSNKQIMNSSFGSLLLNPNLLAFPRAETINGAFSINSSSTVKGMDTNNKKEIFIEKYDSCSQTQGANQLYLKSSTTKSLTSGLHGSFTHVLFNISVKEQENNPLNKAVKNSQISFKTSMLLMPEKHIKDVNLKDTNLKENSNFSINENQLIREQTSKSKFYKSRLESSTFSTTYHDQNDCSEPNNRLTKQNNVLHDKRSNHSTQTESDQTQTGKEESIENIIVNHQIPDLGKQQLSKGTKKKSKLRKWFQPKSETPKDNNIKFGRINKSFMCNYLFYHPVVHIVEELGTKKLTELRKMTLSHLLNF